MPPTHPAHRKMQSLLEHHIREGHERGLQLTAYLDGQLIVDAAAGIADPATHRPVTPDTLFPVFSVSKGIAATILHRLVARRILSYDTPLAQHWPEFAAHNKENITLRHALNHTAGLQNMPLHLDYKTLVSWPAMCNALANETPLSPPGEKMFYHAVTFGHLIGELACRATGKSFPQLLDEEIRQPLGLKNLFIGLPAAEEPRVAFLEEIFEPGAEPNVDDSQPSTVPGWMQPLHTMMNRSDARHACIPASNGIMNARDLARHYAALLPKGIDGIQILSPSQLQQATTPAQPKFPTPNDPHLALGYHVGNPGSEMSSRPTAFGHAGYGGAAGFADPQYHLAVGLTKNLFSKNAAHWQILQSLRETLQIPQ